MTRTLMHPANRMQLPLHLGTAMGATYGVARAAIVHAVKVCDSQGSGTYSNFISGLGW